MTVLSGPHQTLSGGCVFLAAAAFLLGGLRTSLDLGERLAGRRGEARCSLKEQISSKKRCRGVRGIFSWDGLPGSFGFPRQSS